MSDETRRLRRDLDTPRPEVVSFEQHEEELERQARADAERLAAVERGRRGLAMVLKTLEQKRKP